MSDGEHAHASDCWYPVGENGGCKARLSNAAPSGAHATGTPRKGGRSGRERGGQRPPGLLAGDRFMSCEATIVAGRGNAAPQC
jgi:hypothetical protein